jgi:hypothetical protein
MRIYIVRLGFLIQEFVGDSKDMLMDSWINFLLQDLTCILPKYNQVGPKSFSGVPQLPGKFRSEDASFVVEVEKAYSVLTEDGIPRPSSLFYGPTVQPADPMNPPIKLVPGYNPPRKTIYDRFRFLRVFRSLVKVLSIHTFIPIVSNSKSFHLGIRFVLSEGAQY